MTSFTCTVQQTANTDELFLEFPKAMMDELDWREGDTLQWEASSESDSRSFKLVNVSLEERKEAASQELKLYEVQVLVSHRVRYAVKATSAQAATDAILSDNHTASDFDQNCLGTQCLSSREISMAQYLADPSHVGEDTFKVSMIHTVA